MHTHSHILSHTHAYTHHIHAHTGIDHSIFGGSQLEELGAWGHFVMLKGLLVFYDGD